MVVSTRLENRLKIKFNVSKPGENYNTQMVDSEDRVGGKVAGLI
jgi:hypothetical protein